MDVFRRVPFDLRRERNRHPQEKSKKLVLCFQEQEAALSADPILSRSDPGFL